MHPVASASFRKMAGDVGTRQGLSCGLCFFGDHRHADGTADIDLLRALLEWIISKCLAEGFRRVMNLIRLGVIDQHRKLVAAESSDQIALSGTLDQDGADFDQQPVTRAMTKRIVHILEVVEIDVKQCTGLLGALGKVHQTLQFTLEITSIVEASETIMLGD